MYSVRSRRASTGLKSKAPCIAWDSDGPQRASRENYNVERAIQAGLNGIGAGLDGPQEQSTMHSVGFGRASTGLKRKLPRRARDSGGPQRYPGGAQRASRAKHHA